MPELPEVESVVRSLKELVIGQEFRHLELLRDKSLPQGLDFVSQKIAHKTISDVRRRAKFIDLVIKDNQEELHLVTHLKMTGQLIFLAANNQQLAGGGHPTDDWRQQLPGKQTRLIFTFASQNHLFFNDQRVFGWMQVFSNSELNHLYAQLGPDVNTPAWNTDFLAQKLASKRIPIKQALLDNKIGCGLGNIYVAEALFAAAIDPRRPSHSLSFDELKLLVKEVKIVIDRAIAAGGTTFDGRYVDARGQSGSFVEQLNVYGRSGQNCLKCNHSLTAIKQGGRQTVFCEFCQK